jgi:hypothetical protein
MSRTIKDVRTGRVGKKELGNGQQEFINGRKASSLQIARIGRGMKSARSGNSVP